MDGELYEGAVFPFGIEGLLKLQTLPAIRRNLALCLIRPRQALDNAWIDAWPSSNGTVVHLGRLCTPGCDSAVDL
jgi:hypothetical protein